MGLVVVLLAIPHGRIQGEHLAVNDLVVVERVDGITLLVKKVTE